MLRTMAVMIWIVDPLSKLLPDALPPESLPERIEIFCARNEFESAQIAVRSPKRIDRLSVRLSDLQHEERDTSISAKHIEYNFIGFVSIQHNSLETPDEELICRAPAEVPDVLLRGETISLEVDRTQTIRLTVHVPEDTAPGTYTGVVEILADEAVVPIPIQVVVFDFDVPRKRHLYITNWFQDGQLSPHLEMKRGTDDYFRMLQVYAENMAAHRQNVFWIPWYLIRTTKETDGTLSFDYTNFDRYVGAFLEAGVDGRIEIQPVAEHGEGGWASADVRLVEINANDAATGESVKMIPEEGLGPLLQDLERHLEERAWLDRTMIHICDEPYFGNLPAWKEASAFVHRYAPRIKRIEAIETREFDGALEVWVPKLSHLRNWYAWFDGARNRGNELWYYICCHPTGGYMNRFLDYNLIKTRLLHWVNYRYDLTGYLHWGFNFWTGDPFHPEVEELPPGDRNIVYPGPADDPFTLLNSVRWEAQRDSIEDFEYLWVLEQRYREVIERLGEGARGLDPRARGLELCGKLVRSFTDYERDTARFEEIRQAVAREIEEVLQEPLIVLQTTPSEDTYVVPAPTVIEFSGVTRPGARLVVDGKEVPVSDDGKFLCNKFFWEDHHTSRIVVETDQGSKELVREFVPEPR